MAEAETELKFLFEERDLATITSLVSAASGIEGPVHQRLRATYFDTPNCDLWKHGFALRVRTNGTGHVQTLKQFTSSSIDHGEWEAETTGSEPNLDLVRNTPLARLAAKSSIRQALRATFKVNVERTSYLLAVSGGVIEASLDRGAIEADGEKLGVRELELELKSGDHHHLFNLARAFVAQAPLHPSLISKAERGHLLAGGAWGRPAKSSKPRLNKEMTCEQAFQQIGQTCLRDFHLNMLGLEKLKNAEAVHQGRVAVRRLRAAMTLFKPMVFDIAYRRLRGELKWLAQVLGAVRDRDVLRANLLDRATGDEASTQTQASELANCLEAERLRARQAAVEALNSERGRILLLDLVLWIEDGRWKRQASGVTGEPIQSFAGRRLRKRHKKLVRQGADLAHLAPGPRHKVRIEAKELRYMADFFVDCSGIVNDHRSSKKLIDCCEKIQTALGLIRDEEAIAEFMEREVWANVEAAKTAISRTPRATADTKRELKKAVRAYSQLAEINAF
jgi:triphosphatase